MTTATPTAPAGSAVTDALFARRPVWGSFIAGEFQVPAAAETFPVIEAATGKPLAEVVAASPEDVARAVEDSRRAYEEVWSILSPTERGALMRRVAQHIRDHADELAEICAREVGKPRRDALAVDVSSSHRSFDYYAGLTDSIPGQILDQGPIEAHVVYEPYGVVAAILPFNWPPIHFSKKGAPALAVGNTVVIKPGEQAPLTVLRLVELANDILPPGVINAVSGITAGADLVAHPRVERITFTGSTATGRKVLQGAAANLTFATLELGGKNAIIVLEDADVDEAVTTAIEGMFYNQGEACTSTSRILVHDSIAERFTQEFVARARELRVGDPLVADTDIGPLVDARQMERVTEYVRKGVAEGAQLLFAGETPADDHLAEGYFVAPHVFSGVTSQMSIFQEEIFGPVASITTFDDDEAAIRLTNDSEYGLTAAICTSDEMRASRIARRLEVGMVFINNYTRRTFIGSPFGGVKGSGYGREYAAETLHEFVRAKNVRFRSGRGSIPVWPPHAAH